MLPKNNFDCFKLHPKCKARCCSDKTPIPKDIAERNFKKAVRHHISVKDVHGGSFQYETEDGKCIFLNKDLTCNIYEDRPDICKKYGDESHPMMTCSFQAKCGRERSRQERRRIEREQARWVEIFFQSLK